MRHPKSVYITYALYFGLLFVVIITLLSPEYWKRGIKKIRKQSLKTD